MTASPNPSQLHSTRQAQSPLGGLNGGLLAVCGLLVAFGSSCKQEVLCKELGSCGGPNPVGDWSLGTGHPSCMEDLYIPPVDTRLVKADIPTNRSPFPEPAMFDWCVLLIANSADNIQGSPPRFFYESGQIGAATVRYHADGTFSAGLTRTGTFTLDFPAVCMRSFGATDDKPAFINNMPSGPNLPICKQLEVQVRKSGEGEGSYPNTVCDVNPDDKLGCLCSFDVAETGGPSGHYRLLNNNTIIHYTNTGFPAKATYCTDGNNRLQLTGTDGDYLFGQKGLRTLDLGKVVANCGDGAQGPGEGGVDCGGACPTPCPAAPAPAL